MVMCFYMKCVVGLIGILSLNGFMDLFVEFKVIDGGECLGWFIGEYCSCYFCEGVCNG